MPNPRRRTWLIVLAVFLACGALALAVVGPWLLRHVLRPIAAIKAKQNEFEQWVKDRPFHEPETVALDEPKLAAFLALRRDLLDWERQMQGIGRQMPVGRRPSFTELAGVMEGVGGMVGNHLEIYKRHDLTPAEYGYWRRVVYETWLGALVKDGADPAARSRAAKEIDQAAEAESNAVLQARMKQTAATLRARAPAAPLGIPPAVHALLLAHAEEIQTLAAEVRGNSERRSRRSASP
jgi:hypothetical protein